MSNKEQNSAVILITLVVFGLAFLVQAFSGGNSSSSRVAPTPSASRDDSFERRYVEQRFKQEGYSGQDAATAADAILKFQRAQESRRNK